MKRSYLARSFVIVLLLAVFPLCGCVQVTVLPDATVSPASVATPAATATATAATETATAAPTATEAVSPTPVMTATDAPTPATSNPPMYSSYADLVSFDPATGVAQFDYFDLLQGDDAVDYLIDHDGYSKVKAQATVDEFADSEFIKKNEKSQLRAVDLDDVSLKMMIQPNGEPVDSAVSIASSGADVRAIYAVDPAMLSMYFYYIHVESDGHILLVEQVYWP